MSKKTFKTRRLLFGFISPYPEYYKILNYSCKIRNDEYLRFYNKIINLHIKI